MSYKIEFIHKESVYNDIINNWNCAGKKDDSDGHSFEFECDDYFVKCGIIYITVGSNEYIYNVSDFYRIKVMPC
jgi:hypothetical protein